MRRALLLWSSVALVLVLGLVAAWGQLTTTGRVDRAQRADRLHLQVTLGGLTGQYLQFAFLDAQRTATARSWTLRPGDPADRRALRSAVETSHLSGYGAALVTPAGAPLSSWAPRGLPAPDSPGLVPLRAALAAGGPGLSDVLAVGDARVVAFAVPVFQDGALAALLLSYADIRDWPLQGYDSTLTLGRAAQPYVLDSTGTVTASGDATALGHGLGDLPAEATSGRSGVLTLHRGSHAYVVSYAPAAYGWTTVTMQEQEAFSSGLHARTQRNGLVLVVLLTAVVLVLAALNHARQQALRRLAEDRLYDPLTGLAQRRLFHIRLDAALSRHRRSGEPLALLYCDLDAFKAVNDTFGHNLGDQLLTAVAGRMAGAVREDDFCVRLGGDEFAVLLEGTDLAEALRVRERLRAAVEAPLVLGGTTLEPRVSVGGAVLRAPHRAADLLQEADLAMYAVKHGQAESPLVVLDGPAVPVARTPEQQRLERPAAR